MVVAITHVVLRQIFAVAAWLMVLPNLFNCVPMEFAHHVVVVVVMMAQHVLLTPACHRTGSTPTHPSSKIDLIKRSSMNLIYLLVNTLCSCQNILMEIIIKSLIKALHIFRRMLISLSL